MAAKCEMRITRPNFSYLPFQLQPLAYLRKSYCLGSIGVEKCAQFCKLERQNLCQFTKRLQLLGDFVTRPYMAQWRIKVRGHGAMAPLASQHIYLWFSTFTNFRKVGKFAASNVRKLKVFSFSWRLCPFVIGSSSALAMACPRFQTPSAVYVYMQRLVVNHICICHRRRGLAIEILATFCTRRSDVSHIRCR